MNDVEIEAVAEALLKADATGEGVTAKRIATLADMRVDEVVFLLRGSKKVYLSIAEGPGADGLARYRRY